MNQTDSLSLKFNLRLQLASLVLVPGYLLVQNLLVLFPPVATQVIELFDLGVLGLNVTIFTYSLVFNGLGQLLAQLHHILLQVGLTCADVGGRLVELVRLVTLLDLVLL